MELIDALIFQFQHHHNPESVNLIMRRGEQADIERMLEEHVQPYAPEHPTILDVGVGMRVEELEALLMLQPRSITGLIYDTKGQGSIGLAKWALHDSRTNDSQVKGKVRLVPGDVRDHHGGPYDVVCALGIAPQLQNDLDMREIINHSKGLVVVTSYRGSRLQWPEESEPAHIDHVLDPWSAQLKIRMQPMEYGNDSHIWVLQK